MKNLVLLLGLGILGAVAPARATSFAQKSFPTAVQDAPVIVRGTIGMSYADYGKNSAEERRIYTYYELVPTEVLKGEVRPGPITIRQLGGTKEGVTMEVPGTARFSRGEEVVVFLGDAGEDGAHEMRGMMMGKFGIEKVDGKEYLSGPGAQPPAVVREGEVIHPGEGDSASKNIYTLEALRELIRTKDAGTAPAPNPTQGMPALSVGSGETTATPAPAPSSIGSEPAAAKPSAEGAQRWVWGVVLIGLWLLIRQMRRSGRR